MSYLGFNYVGLDRVILGSGYDVNADFKDSGGIFVNAEVTYRGVAVGRVTDMKLVDDGVRVVLTIDPDADPIPAATEAFVATRSAVGEQYVDLRPASGRRPLSRGRLGHPGRPHRDPGARSSSCCCTWTGWSARSTRTTCGSSSTSWGRRSPVPATTWAG